MVPVPLNSERIYFKGANYLYGDEAQIEPLRFSREVLELPMSQLNFNPEIARMSSGIQMVFSTRSPVIQVDLLLKPFRQNQTATCRVYCDGVLDKDFTFQREQEDNSVQIDLEHNDGKIHCYRIDLPSTAEAVVTGFLIDKNFDLEPIRFKAQPVYVALGDSITHGSVALEGVSCLSYPALLSQKLGYDLYNLGVGGSRVSPVIGEMLADWYQIDLITLLIGANDFSWAGVPPERYRKKYEELLAAIRKHHPTVPLYCITLTYTTRAAGKTGDSTEAYRQVVREVVLGKRDRGDGNIFLLEGPAMSGSDDLHDWVHLSKKGNQRFADHLYDTIVENFLQN